MMLKTTTGLATVALLALAAAVPASAASAKAAKTAAAKVHSPASVECSKEADAKGLHGKDRAKFRSQCKKTYAAEHKAAAATPSPAKTQ